MALHGLEIVNKIMYNGYERHYMDELLFTAEYTSEALEQLSEKEKAVIVLYYFEDLSIKEIASILQMPVGTVKYHLSYGRNHLRNFLQ